MFKRLRSRDYTVTPFRANKFWRVTSDSEDPFVETLTGIKLNRHFYEDEDPKNENGTYMRGVYDLIYHMYYKHDSPFNKFGIYNYDGIHLQDFPTKLLSVIHVIKISNQYFGEKILPNSIKLTSIIDGLDITIVDDGKGNLIDQDTEEHVGNVFYTNGLLVLTHREPEETLEVETPDYTTFPNYYVINSEFEEIQYQPGQSAFPDYEVSPYEFVFRFYNLEFRGELTHYEHEFRCAIEPGEFNGTSNPSVKDGDTVIEYVKSEEFSPFITTVGLYDEFLNLIAVGKLAKPVQKPREIPMTLVVRMDM